MVEIGIVSVCGNTMCYLNYSEEPNRTTRISTVAKWEMWFRENHGDFTGSSLLFIHALNTLPKKRN